MAKIYNNRRCSVDGCNNLHHARGLCLYHYNQTTYRIQSRKKYELRGVRPEWHRPNTGRRGSLLSIEEKRKRANANVRRWRLAHPFCNRSKSAKIL